MTQNVQYKRVDDKDNGHPPFGLATCDGWGHGAPIRNRVPKRECAECAGKMAHTWKHTDERWKDAYNELPTF